MAGELLRCAWWFNPLVWIACARLRQESEQACDDEVLIGGVEGPAYAAELLELARALKPAPALYSPAAAIARTSGLERRIRAMLNAGVTRNRGTLTLPLGTLQETVSVRGGDGTQSTRQPAALTSARDAFQRELAGCASEAAGGRVRPPRKIRNVAPVYPASLQDAGIAGRVVLRGTIGTDGTLHDIQVIRSAHPDLDNAAVEAVRQWEFDGVLLNCSPVEAGITVSIDFSPR
jgi:TonB family protein